MSTSPPVLRRTGWGVLAGAAAGGLVAVQGMDDWPTVRTAAVVLTPVPLALATARAGTVGAAASFGIASIAVGAGAGGPDLPVWAFVVGYGGVVAFVFYAAARIQHANTVMFAGLAVASALALLVLAVRAQQGGQSLPQAYAGLLQELQDEVTAGPAVRELDPEVQEQLRATVPVARRLLPAFAVLQYGSSLLIAAWIALAVLRRWGGRRLPRGDFGAWRLPEWFVFCFIAAAGGLLLGLWREWTGLTTVCANLLLVLGGIYLAQGGAIFRALMRRLGAHPLIEAGVIVLAVLLFREMVILLLAVAGLFDFLVDFRGRWAPASPAPGERPEP